MVGATCRRKYNVKLCCSGEQKATKRLFCGRCRPTCSHKQDPSSQDDVPLALVEAAGGHADSAQQQQDGAEDGEDAGGSHHTWQRRDGAAPQYRTVKDSHSNRLCLCLMTWTQT